MGSAQKLFPWHPNKPKKLISTEREQKLIEIRKKGEP